MKHSETYSFVVYKYPNGKLTERTEIPIRITNPATGDACIVFALIDTGADTCVIPKNLSDKLNHNFSAEGVHSTITGGIGGQSKTFKHTFNLEILNSDRNKVVYSVGNLLVDCVDENIPPLIGVKDFLQHFEVEIDYPAKTIALSWN